MRVLGTLSVSLRLWHPDVRRDPYPTYRRFRERRIVRMRLFGSVVVAGHHDVERVLRESAFSTHRDQVALMKMLRLSRRSRPSFRHSGSGTTIDSSARGPSLSERLYGRACCRSQSYRSGDPYPRSHVPPWSRSR